jgi:hypothetical protein
MRTKRVVLGLALSVGCGIAAPAVFAEEYRGTFEQQLACTPDVRRLCGDQIPDVNRIVACLRQKTPQLSGTCRAVFESNASASVQPAPRARAAPPKPPAAQPKPYDDE